MRLPSRASNIRKSEQKLRNQENIFGNMGHASASVRVVHRNNDGRGIGDVYYKPHTSNRCCFLRHTASGNTVDGAIIWPEQFQQHRQWWLWRTFERVHVLHSIHTCRIDDERFAGHFDIDASRTPW